MLCNTYNTILAKIFSSFVHFVTMTGLCDLRYFVGNISNLGECVCKVLFLDINLHSELDNCIWNEKYIILHSRIIKYFLTQR